MCDVFNIVECNIYLLKFMKISFNARKTTLFHYSKGQKRQNTQQTKFVKVNSNLPNQTIYCFCWSLENICQEINATRDIILRYFSLFYVRAVWTKLTNAYTITRTSWNVDICIWSKWDRIMTINYCSRISARTISNSYNYVCI